MINNGEKLGVKEILILKINKISSNIRLNRLFEIKKRE